MESNLRLQWLFWVVISNIHNQESKLFQMFIRLLENLAMNRQNCSVYLEDNAIWASPWCISCYSPNSLKIFQAHHIIFFKKNYEVRTGQASSVSREQDTGLQIERTLPKLYTTYREILKEPIQLLGFLIHTASYVRSLSFTNIKSNHWSIRRADANNNSSLAKNSLRMRAKDSTCCRKAELLEPI